jgi:hypothetical protein
MPKGFRTTSCIVFPAPCPGVFLPDSSAGFQQPRAQGFPEADLAASCLLLFVKPKSCFAKTCASEHICFLHRGAGHGTHNHGYVVVALLLLQKQPSEYMSLWCAVMFCVGWCGSHLLLPGKRRTGWLPETHKKASAACRLLSFTTDSTILCSIAA